MGETSVLVVDDDEQICRLLRRVLVGAGYTCDSVSTLTDAKARIAERPYQVALVDVLMGPQSGLDLVADLLRDPDDLAVLVLTVLDDRELARAALDAGVSGYLIKPFTPNEILINVASALRRRQLRIENREHRENLERLVEERTAELTDAEARYRGLFEHVPVGLFRSTREGRILDANPAYLELLGFPSLEAACATDAHAIYLDPADRDRWMQISDRDGVVRDFEMQARRFDGEVIWARLTARSVCSPNGEGGSYEGIVSDVTELKRVEEARRASEERFRLLAENALDMVFNFRMLPEQGLDYVSPSVEPLLGYTPEELYADPLLLFEVIHPEDRPRLEQAIVDARVETLELRWRHRDGRLLWIESRSRPVFDDDGRLVAFQGIARDISARREAQEALRLANEERGRLLSSLVSAQEEERQRIAGDIHDDSLQVMTGVGMRLHALRRGIPDPGLVEQVDKLEDIVGLSISRLRHMLFELRPPTLDREGLGPALRLYVSQTGTEDGPEYVVRDELRADPPPDARVVLYRITQEAITNARKHAGANRVEVRLVDRQGGVLVTVRDDGRGFDPKLVDEHRPGHLGLAAIRERAEMAGGWVKVESSPGAGAAVRFWIPSPEEPERAAG